MERSATPRAARGDLKVLTELLEPSASGVHLLASVEAYLLEMRAMRLKVPARKSNA